MVSLVKKARAAAILLTLSAGLLAAALWRSPDGEPAGWVPVNRQVAAVLEDAPQEAEGKAAEDRPAAEPEEASAAGGREDAGAAAAAPDADGGEETAAAASGGAAGVPAAASGSGAPASAAPAAEAGDGPRPDGRLDINRASAEELDALPGIGEAKARAIVEDRTRNGFYRSVSDLDRVKGIGPKMLDKLRERIVAEP